MEAQYVVLNDGDTYSSVEGTYVYILSPHGEDQLNQNNTFSDISEVNIVKTVSLRDLIDCWNNNNP